MYQWADGLCDGAATISVDRDGAGVALFRRDVPRDPTGSGCLLEAISRFVVIDFREPVDPTLFADRTDMLTTSR